MGKRKLQVVTSADGDEDLTPEEKKRKQRRLRDEEEKDDEEECGRGAEDGGGGEEEGEEEEETVPEDARPIGEAIKVSGKGKKKKKYYKSFEYDGNVFELEDPVLLTPEDMHQKPYVAIIKEITQDVDGSLMVTGQWFYRPEEAGKRGGGSWKARDTRELFYSFHLDDVPAESVMHKCVAHFVPLHKEFPLRSQHPGFIVQKVYDVLEKKLCKLTDEDYEDNKQHEINLLVQKTAELIGELPDIEPEDTPADHGDQTSKWNLRRKNMHPIDVSKSDDATTRSEHLMKAETPGSCMSDVSEYHVILAKFKALTGDIFRDMWLEKLLQGIEIACKSKQDALAEDKRKGSLVTSNHPINDNNGASTVTGSKDKSSEVNDEVERVCWPDTAVMAITALEKASHETFGSDFQKYNQKMRKMDFKVKNNVLLASRLLNEELDPEVILSMPPDELKDGLTAEEKTPKEAEEPKSMQVTDARCSRCTAKKLDIVDIIHAGYGDRDQLACMACGHTWYAPQDAISSSTIDAPNVASNVGTAKFEEVEKRKMVSPREPENPDTDYFRNSAAAHMAVLETHKMFDGSKAEDPSVPAVANQE